VVGKIVEVLGRGHRTAVAANEPGEARAILHVTHEFANELAAARPDFDRVRFIGRSPRIGHDGRWIESAPTVEATSTRRDAHDATASVRGGKATTGARRNARGCACVQSQRQGARRAHDECAAVGVAQRGGDDVVGSSSTTGGPAANTVLTMDESVGRFVSPDHVRCTSACSPSAREVRYQS
jgi:hypothetical protein